MYFAFDNLLNVVLEWFLRPVEASADSVNDCPSLYAETYENCHPICNVEHENGPDEPNRASLCMLITVIGIIQTSAQSTQGFGTPMQMTQQVQFGTGIQQPPQMTALPSQIL